MTYISRIITSIGADLYLYFNKHKQGSWLSVKEADNLNDLLGGLNYSLAAFATRDEAKKRASDQCLSMNADSLHTFEPSYLFHATIEAS